MKIAKRIETIFFGFVSRAVSKKLAHTRIYSYIHIFTIFIFSKLLFFDYCHHANRFVRGPSSWPFSSQNVCLCCLCCRLLQRETTTLTIEPSMSMTTTNWTTTMTKPLHAWYRPARRTKRPSTPIATAHRSCSYCLDWLQPANSSETNHSTEFIFRSKRKKIWEYYESKEQRAKKNL